MYTVCRSFAAHIVMNGMQTYVIDVDQLGGFLSNYMVANTVLKSILVIGSECTISTLHSFEIVTIHTMLPGDVWRFEAQVQYIHHFSRDEAVYGRFETCHFVCGLRIRTRI